MQIVGITKLINTKSLAIECQTDKIVAITVAAKMIAVKSVLFLAILEDSLRGQKNIKTMLNLEA